MANYGRVIKTAGPAGLGAPVGSPPSKFDFPQSIPLFYEILETLRKNPSSYKRYWDDTAKAPYLLGIPGTSTESAFLTYEDPLSSYEKGRFIKKEGLKGAIVWEATGDILETPENYGGLTLPAGEAVLTDWLIRGMMQ